MRRVISLWLPTWPTDRIRKRNPTAPPRDKPLVTVRREGATRVIAGVYRAAREAGLRAGITLTHAQALIPDLAVVDARPEEDTEALTRLALWGLWCAPLVAPDPPDGLWIDVAGSAHLFGGEAALLRSLAARLRGGGCAVRLAVADTPGTAWAVARFAPRGTTPIVAPGQMSSAIASLPVRALRLPAETVQALHELGIERIAQLAALPRGALSLRLGQSVMHRFDQALGHEPEPLVWSERSDLVATTRKFAEPISALSTLERVATDLTLALMQDLARHGLGARRLDLGFRRVDGGIQAVCIGTAAATRDGIHLARLLCARLAGVDPGFGIDEATLTAAITETLDAVQAEGLGGGGRAEPDLAVLIDRLATRRGLRELFRVVPVESRIPERSVRRTPPLAPKTGLSWPSALERPVTLFDPPQRITATALLPDAPPAFFVWGQVRHRAVRADGPERVRGEWWISETEVSSMRDYYRVETDAGGRYWVFRDAPITEGPRWWLQGVFG